MNRAQLYNWLVDRTTPLRWFVAHRLKLDEKPNVCWSEVVMWAQGYEGIVGRDRFETAMQNGRCREDAKRDGYCYCARMACRSRLVELGADPSEIRPLEWIESNGGTDAE